MYQCLIKNLRAGARLTTLRRADFEVSIAQLVILLAMGWAAALVSDWSQIAGPVAWSGWGGVVGAARGYTWLAALAVVVLIAGNAALYLRLAVALAAADVILWVIWLVLLTAWPRISEAGFTHYGSHLWSGFFGWQIAVFIRAYTQIAGNFRPAALMGVAAYGCMLYANVKWLPDEALLVARANETRRPAINVEDTYYRQAELLDHELAAIEPSKRGQRDLYLVAFGGYGEEDVFKREVLQVSQIMGERFGTGARTVRLINNYTSLTDHPLANRPNLAYIFGHLAARMQLDEDIVFLFMTSHGAQDGRFAIELGDLGLNDLTPDALRRVLDNAGIKWRVVVVSACYSGQFIAPLSSPDTLVITAAAKDKTSFGCAHENRWTYFGEAYFKDALASTHSFTAAFNTAARAIAAREAKEGKEASDPQMVLGAAIAPVLLEFEAHFPDAARPTILRQ